MIFKCPKKLQIYKYHPQVAQSLDTVLVIIEFICSYYSQIKTVVFIKYSVTWVYLLNVKALNQNYNHLAFCF